PLAAGTQPPTISGPNAASGPLNGLNSPTTSVAGGDPLPPAELQAAATASVSAAPSDVTAILIAPLPVMMCRWQPSACQAPPSRRARQATASIPSTALSFSPPP